MAYRLALTVMMVLAVVLTLNERWQEQRAFALADGGAHLSGPDGDAYSAASSGSAAPSPAVAFVSHRVRLRREVDLLQAPEPDAQPVEGTGRVLPGILLQALDERGGWYLVDTSLSRGWAPTDAFGEP